MPVKDYLKRRQGMKDPFDRRIGFIGVALVFENMQKDGKAWQEIKPTLDHLLRSNDVWAQAPFLYAQLAYRYGIKNDLKVEFQRINKKYGALPIALELDMHILEWADQHNYALLRDIFMVAALEALVQVCKKYKLDDKTPIIETELAKYHPIPNTLQEAQEYEDTGLLRD
ncbi:MAG: hypothetical protein CMM87_00165 [Rickettsiales bacterium]|nr:hypothetical protein [Rickettsiales bacterium]|tara:strand:+ start:15343 stop:15852 length:510 start_codon:yes stop_codon:yes gene_type:complete